MEFRQTYSREHLQSLYRKSCLQVVKQKVERMGNEVVRAASQGNKTSHAIAISKEHTMVASYPGEYIPTNEDLVDGFKQMFPGCSVTLKDDWVDVRPGVREQKTVIVVDWS